MLTSPKKTLPILCEGDPAVMTGASLRFPEGFLWGASTAAHQVEGNNVNNDWWMREHSSAHGIVEPSGDACDSYHRYREDIALLAGLGFNTYRFSLEWSRIEPEAGYVSRVHRPLPTHGRRLPRVRPDPNGDPPALHRAEMDGGPGPLAQP